MPDKVDFLEPHACLQSCYRIRSTWGSVLTTPYSLECSFQAFLRFKAMILGMHLHIGMGALSVSKMWLSLYITIGKVLLTSLSLKS